MVVTEAGEGGRQAQSSDLLAPVQVKDHITKLAKKGKTPSEIGVFLRDQHGIAQVRSWTLWALPAAIRPPRQQCTAVLEHAC